ncbi:hypothetical protein NDU88_003879 [Pleurodeles waltl]|uniref:Uncharacterized protein n=1 Tax=Pleurodeles waltl TaxID=8319 RepID=A0AAV7UDR2_PLEWA|nr:hypothetical protein NDU88_003879 [Pleurodeles waltl]
MKTAGTSNSDLVYNKTRTITALDHDSGTPSLTAALGKGACDGSDRSDPHSIAPSTVSAWVAPEATHRAALHIGYTRDERAVKGEFPERKEEFVRSGNLQEGVSGADRRIERTREERSRRSSGVPGERTRLEPRALTVPTRDEDCWPREADA